MLSDGRHEAPGTKSKCLYTHLRLQAAGANLLKQLKASISLQDNEIQTVSKECASGQCP